MFISQWFDNDTPESAPFPLRYEESLTDFQRLMLLRCFRVDRIYRAVTEYVTKIMGEKYVTPPIISFESIYEQSTPMSPIVFILSPGSDPATDLLKLAERSGFGTNKLKYLSLGQGQEKVCKQSSYQCHYILRCEENVLDINIYYMTRLTLQADWLIPGHMTWAKINIHLWKVIITDSLVHNVILQADWLISDHMTWTKINIQYRLHTFNKQWSEIHVYL